MGNSCCHAESPCGSAEERSVLLKDDSKAAVPTAETVVVGACGPEENDDLRNTFDETSLKVEDKDLLVSPKDGEAERCTAQENGPFQKESCQTVSPGIKENSNRAQDVDIKKSAADTEPAERLQCTLNTLQKVHRAADWEVPGVKTVAPEEENLVSVQEKILNGISQTAEAVYPEKPSFTETNAKSEHITMDTTNNNNEEASDGHKQTIDKSVAEPSGKTFQNDEGLLMPNTELAAASGQVSPISVISQELNTEAPSCSAEDDSEKSSSPVCTEANPEDIKSHDVPESCAGPESTGLDHSGVATGDSANSVKDPDPVTTAAVDASESSDQVVKSDPKCTTTSSKEVALSETVIQDDSEDINPEVQVEDGDDPTGQRGDEVEEAEAVTQAVTDVEANGKDQHLVEDTSTQVRPDAVPVTDKEESAEDGLGNSDEDLYRGAEELSAASQTPTAGLTPVLETTFPKVEDRRSLAPAVDILSYSEREWKGNTAKSALIRKGYKEMSQRFGSLRRVRGDNYCALRATLYQVLSHSTQLPAWLQDDDITALPKELEAREGLLSQWTFPGECVQGDRTGDAAQQLKGYMELLRNKWQAAVSCSSAAEREELCELVFQGGEEELGLLEALKLLMLGRAVELHGSMQSGGDAPLFCWLLFARDSSDCPRSFLSNHLSHVGLSAGLEQVEMFLLGYALQCTIQVYRLYKADTEEFVTFYPDDHKDDWPSVCLVTEDDRHYNVPVAEAAELPKEPSSS